MYVYVTDEAIDGVLMIVVMVYIVFVPGVSSLCSPYLDK